MRYVGFFAAVGLVLAVTATAGALSLPDGTVTANRQDSGTGLNAWFGESVTAQTIDAQNISPGSWVEVSGKITGISATSTSWVEIGLIPKATWDYWQTAFGGAYKSAVFDKGIYVVDWSSGGLGLSLDENTTSGAVFAWPLSDPTTSPWDFTITMVPTGSSGGNAYLTVAGATMYGTQPRAYTGNYGDSYLIARIWSNTQNASFSFEDAQAKVVPEPVTMAGLALGIGSLATYLRRRKAV